MACIKHDTPDFKDERSRVPRQLIGFCKGSIAPVDHSRKTKNGKNLKIRRPVAIPYIHGVSHRLKKLSEKNELVFPAPSKLKDVWQDERKAHG